MPGGIATQGIVPTDRIAGYWSVEQEYTAQQTNVSVIGAPGPGHALRVTQVYVHIDGAVDVTLKQGTGAMKFNFYGQAAGDGVSAPGLVVRLDENTGLTITTTGAIAVTLVCGGYVEKVF